jgi:hypothetical protein
MGGTKQHSDVSSSPNATLPPSLSAALSQDDCHVNVPFLERWHLAVTVIYGFAFLLSALGLFFALDRDVTAYKQVMGKKKSQEMKDLEKRMTNASKQSNDKSDKSGTSSVASLNSVTDESPKAPERSVIEKATIPAPTGFGSYISILREMQRQKKYFKIGKLFGLHFIFSLCGGIYLVMTLQGIYRIDNNAFQNLALSVAASALFAGLWEVVEIWHRAIPKSLVKRADKTRMTGGGQTELPAELKNASTAQAKVLVFLQDGKTMAFTLSLVLASVIVSIFQIANDKEGVGYDVFEYLVFAIFLLELVIRIYCWYCCFKNKSFFGDKYNLLDVLVVLIDVLIIGVSLSAGKSTGDTAGDVGGFAKILRVVRFCRVLRILRAIRMFSVIGSKSLLHSEVRVRRIVVLHSRVGALWFSVAGLVLPLALGNNKVGDRMLMMGMFITITDFVAAMVIICLDIKRMLDDVLSNGSKETQKNEIFLKAEFKRKVTLGGVLTIGPVASIFTLLLSVSPLFHPDGSFWFTVSQVASTHRRQQQLPFPIHPFFVTTNPPSPLPLKLCALLAVCWNVLMFLIINRGKLQEAQAKLASRSRSSRATISAVSPAPTEQK